MTYKEKNDFFNLVYPNVFLSDLEKEYIIDTFVEPTIDGEKLEWQNFYSNYYDDGFDDLITAFKENTLLFQDLNEYLWFRFNYNNSYNLLVKHYFPNYKNEYDSTYWNTFNNDQVYKIVNDYIEEGDEQVTVFSSGAIFMNNICFNMRGEIDDRILGVHQ